VAAVELGGYRTVLAVPMLKESDIIGLLVFVRQEVRPFNDKQIGLLQNFASQAVIAIGNDPTIVSGHIIDLMVLAATPHQSGIGKGTGISGPVRVWAAVRPSLVESRFEAHTRLPRQARPSTLASLKRVCQVARHHSARCSLLSVGIRPLRMP
jgi:signal transduction protein with GAF and PtsI domain